VVGGSLGMPAFVCLAAGLLGRVGLRVGLETTRTGKDFTMRRSRLIAVVALIVLVPAVGGGGEWPQFRGPAGSGVSSEGTLPAAWDSGKNIAWKATLPGYGWSSPVVWGDKIFLTTAVSDKQRKPTAMYSPGESGGRGGPGPGGFRPPSPTQILPSFLQGMLNLTDEQKKQMEELQKEVDDKLGTILTDEQKKQLRQPPPGPGSFGSFPQPGQVLSPALQERLKLTADQKQQRQQLQEIVDARLAELLKDEQKNQLQAMRQGPGRGGFGGPGGFGRPQPPPNVVYRWEVYCLDRSTGNVLWKQVAREGKPRIPIQASNTYASETPVTDGERLYAYFGMHGVYCYDLAGKPLWQVDLGSYPTVLGFGTGSSPALDDGRLFVQCDNEEKSFLVALDARTGKELWRVDRPERTSYSTPFVWKNKQRTEVVCLGSPKVRAYDPATGKQLWELGGMTGQPKASPVGDADLLYVGSPGGPGGMFGGPGGPGGGRPGGGPPPGGGFGGGARPLVAVKAGASGDITVKSGATSNDGVAWSLPQAGPPTATPLLYRGQLYILEERGGLLSCYDAGTGKQFYKERLPGARGFTSSPLAVDGKVYCLDDGGTTFVVQAGPEFKLLGKNSLGEMCWASPAVAGGELLVRTVDTLYCVKQGAGGTP
jgi:outer membrane protein assembly factor BamB